MIRLNYSTLLYSARLPILPFSHFNHWFMPSPLNELLVTCQHQATAFDLPFYDIFASTKISLSKCRMTSLHVICGLGPPPIKNPGYAYGLLYSSKIELEYGTLVRYGSRCEVRSTQILNVPYLTAILGFHVWNEVI